MADKSVVLTAAESSAGLKAMRNVCIVAAVHGLRDPIPELVRFREGAEAIASGQVVCIEAERLVRMEAALRFYADEASHHCGSSERGSPIDFDSGQKARDALAAQEVKS